MEVERDSDSLPISNIPAAAISEKQIDGVLTTDKGSEPDKKVGGRIAPVLRHLKGLDFPDSDSDWVAGSEILGKQIELEVGNGLQYRTCSWQKVDISTGCHFLCSLQNIEWPC